MKLIKDIAEIQAEIKQWRKSLDNPSVGFVPTMGALHAGHAELLRRARAENDFAVLSIFVNPTQFNDPKDLEKYPRTLEADSQWAAEKGIDIVWTPDAPAMYPDNYRYKLTENELSLNLCGAHRPGHFDGVLSVVMKLFNVVSPTRAYFGEKDFQQMSLIQGMVKAFFMPLEIVPVPTVRESDGLAMSSRNTRLTPADRKLAPLIYKVLTTVKDKSTAIKQLEEAGFRVEYLEDQNNRRLLAAWLGEVRLIDNVAI